MNRISIVNGFKVYRVFLLMLKDNPIVWNRLHKSEIGLTRTQRRKCINSDRISNSNKEFHETIKCKLLISLNKERLLENLKDKKYKDTVTLSVYYRICK